IFGVFFRSNRLLNLYHYLQDPHLVARFQHFCGHNNGACRRRVAGGDDSGYPAPGNEKAPGSSGTVKPLRKNSLTGDAGQEFLIQNRFLYYAFTLGTELGNELFYITFFPFVTWNVDAFVSRRLIMVWVWVMYLGQCTKDLLGWSRPASPPVIKVEMFYNSEYSMPSTHAMSGTAIPFSLFFMTYGRWEVRATRMVQRMPMERKLAPTSPRFVPTTYKNKF
uniref:Sphingosine-1-phosphate phosphatase 1 n=1 Tax=Gasterosteus aculeatus aculeatus TaxID=481459 RepID=G3P9U1_GASAC